MNKSRKRIAQDYSRNSIVDKRRGDYKASRYEAEQAIKEAAGEGPSMMGQVKKGSMATMRSGNVGNYTGNHPRFASKGVSMNADLAFNPTDDIAGQGTEGMTPGAPTANLNKGYGQQIGKPSVAKMYGGKKGDDSKSKKDFIK